MEGWDYDVALIGSTVYFKFTSFNQSGLVEENIADVPAYPFLISGACIGLLTPAHASYMPSSNPLTAIDAGASATIDIASFQMIVPGVPNVSLSSGAITGLLYNTLYYVYFYDPTFESIAPTYLASTTKTDAIDSAGYMFVGSILTPSAGYLGATIGNNDGGAGAQMGVTSLLGFNSQTNATTGTGSVTNPANIIDGNPADSTGIDAPSGGNSASVTLAAPTSILQRISRIGLQFTYSGTINGASGVGNTGKVNIIVTTPLGANTINFLHSSSSTVFYPETLAFVDLTEYLAPLVSLAGVTVEIQSITTGTGGAVSMAFSGAVLEFIQ